MLITGGADRKAKRWTTDKGQRIGEPINHPGSVSFVAFSPNGEAILTGCADGVARVWKNEGENPPAQARLTHQGDILAGAFNADGTMVVTACADGTARVWDLPSGNARGAALSHLAAVNVVAFSPDGKTVLTGSADKTAQLWDVASTKLIGYPLTFQGSVVFVAFSKDGRNLLSVGADGVARITDPPQALPPGVDRIRLWIEVTTGMELDDEGRVRPLSDDVWARRRDRLQQLGGLPAP
jgi:WD40 repeat protein